MSHGSRMPAAIAVLTAFFALTAAPLPDELIQTMRKHAWAHKNDEATAVLRERKKDQ